MRTVLVNLYQRFLRGALFWVYFCLFDYEENSFYKNLQTTKNHARLKNHIQWVERHHFLIKGQKCASRRQTKSGLKGHKVMSN